MMTEKQMSEAAEQFSKDWAKATYERGQAQPFWIALLRKVFGIDDAEQYISFEKQVKSTTTHFADGFIKNSRVLIEHKSADVDLNKKYYHGDEMLTPFEQAKKYDNDVLFSNHARWIITCNFKQFFIYNMNKLGFPHIEIELKNLRRDYRKLKVLIEPYTTFLDNEETKEKLVASKASEFVRKMYDEIRKHNKVDKKFLHSLNVFCVRVVFCLYADDSFLFDDRQFRKFVEAYSANQLQEKFDHLFIALNTPTEKRPSITDAVIKQFPHVNGGLFANDPDYSTPKIPQSVKNMLLNEAENLGMPDSDEKFTWDKISPTNFGCIFESTVDDEVRKSGGMHYTTVENIHRVIDPLFLDGFKDRLRDISEMPNETKEERQAQDDALQELRLDMKSIRVLDPACGSGNFLTETFKSLRRIDMEARKLMGFWGKQQYLDNTDPCEVQMTQFYGIEIDDFAVNVAKTAMWISECQMLKELSKEIEGIRILPLLSNNNIKCADALKYDWAKLVKRNKKTPVYIIGNPPFQGSQRKNEEQKQSKAFAMSAEYNGKKIWEKHGNLDFACAWYAKAAEFMQGYSNIQTAYVSTNSVTQGEQVALLWEPLIKHYKLCITFAWKSFKWFNKADSMAHVHCVIVGIGKASNFKDAKRRIYNIGKEALLVDNINCYLMDAEDIFIKSRPKALGNVPEMVKGSIPVDGGNLLISEDVYKEFAEKEPEALQFIKPCFGAKEFLHNFHRYCLWIPDETPNSLLKNLPMVWKRLKAVEKFREDSPKKATQLYAKQMHRFMERRQPNTDYILVPSHSSENRDYVPMGIVSPDIISSNANLLIATPSKWLFGILESRIHMAWMKYTCGRLETRNRYSADVVYNNFPWIGLTDEQKAAIEKTTDDILEARKSDSKSTLADMYDYLKGKLLEAHKANDKLVAKIYGIETQNEEEIVLELMRRSVEMSKKADKPKKKRKVRKLTKTKKSKK
ncbi:MAG: N-6 DNA methylase [Prevotella sp.]|nr:N-6 DNA methylase [Prevotella sp.]